MVTDAREVQEQKALAPMLVMLAGIDTDIRPEDIKAPEPMLVTPLGMVTDVRFPQPSNAQLPMVLSCDDSEAKVTVARLLHAAKALEPMRVTLAGIVTDIRFLQLENAFLPMLVTLAGMVIDVRPDLLKA